MTDTLKILVTGANGHLGRRVANLLLDAGANVVAGSRDTAKLAELEARGAEVRKVDFDDAQSLQAAFAGIDRALIVSTDALMVEGQREKQQVAAANAAVAAGVKHIVYTSMIDPAGNLYIPIAPSHAATEKALKASGVSHTVLRNAWYTEYLAATLKDAMAKGQWVTSAGDGKVSYVTREDCARAAVAALLKGSDAAGTFDVTGPEALTATEIAAVVGRATGKPLAVVPITEEGLTAGMRAGHVPEMFVSLAATIDRANRNGVMSRVSNAVEKLTGHKPASLADYLAANTTALA